MASTVPITSQSLGAAQAMAGSSSTSSSSSGSTNSKGSTSLDMNAFLTMFTTQLQYQDPTNPMESYELAAQLAQFSSVEGINQVNTNLQTVQTYLASLNNAQMVGLVGKEVVTNSDALRVTSGTATTAAYTLPADSTVTVEIYNDQGQVVRTMSQGAQTAGNHNLQWDGKDDSGQTVADGDYTCKVSAVAASGETSNIATTVTGQVYSFVMNSTSPYVILGGPNGAHVPISAISQVSDPTTA